jgi:hypothetical protein
MKKIANTIMVNGKRMVCRIYYQKEAHDCYTVAFKAKRSRGSIYYPYMALTESGFVCTYGENPSFINGKHIGKRVAFNDVPVRMQNAIIDYFKV